MIYKFKLTFNNLYLPEYPIGINFEEHRIIITLVINKQKRNQL